jgi:hypothetical protein
MDHAASISWEVRKPVSFPIPKEKEREEREEKEEKDKKEVSHSIEIFTATFHVEPAY